MDRQSIATGTCALGITAASEVCDRWFDVDVVPTWALVVASGVSFGIAFMPWRWMILAKRVLLQHREFLVVCGAWCGAGLGCRTGMGRDMAHF